MKTTGNPLSELKRCLKKYPQTQRNLIVREKRPLEELPSVMQLIGDTERELSGQGRVLLRYSGTEPKARLLLEGPDADELNELAEGIMDELAKNLGA